MYRMSHKPVCNIFHSHRVVSWCVVGVLLVVTVLTVSRIPATSVYKNTVRTLFFSKHQALAYYFNYKDPQLAIFIGNYYFGGEAYDLNRAQKSYERALVLTPNTRLAHYQLARIYFVEGDLPGALKHINEELQIDPLTLRSLYVRGLIKLSQHDLRGSEADFRAFTQWAPGEWGGYNDLSFVLAKEGKYAESEAVVRQAFIKVPNAKDVSWLWNSLGLAQLNQYKFKDAVVSFTHALTMSDAVTSKVWRRAYSGNDPAGDTTSIVTYQQAIKTNLKAAQVGATIQESN